VVQNDADSSKEVSGLLPTGIAFWKKFNASAFNGNSIAATKSLRMGSSSKVMNDEELKLAQQLQHKVVKAMEDCEYRRLLATGVPKDACRLADCSWECAGIINHVQPLEVVLWLRDWEMQSVKRHQYGLVPLVAANQLWYCKCGHAIEAGHNHRCKRVSGPATFHRHQCVVAALAKVAKEHCGLTVEFTPRIWSDVKNKEEEEYVIPDIIFSGVGGARLAIDVSGVYGESDSYLPDRIVPGWCAEEIRRTAVVEKRERAKEKHYSKLDRSGELSFSPFVFESHGGFGDSAERVVQWMAHHGSECNGVSEAVMTGYIRRIVAIAIQRGNAGLDSVARSRQAGSYGSLVARGVVAVDVRG
jgi:hypothetical protein